MDFNSLLSRGFVRYLQVVLVCGVALAESSAQSASPGPQGGEPSPRLILQTEGEQKNFHLGEEINIKTGYAASAPGQFVYVTRPEKLQGGRAERISCEPASDVVDRRSNSGRISVTDFLYAGTHCGVGGGIGVGGCGDCDGEYKLAVTPVWFPRVLNHDLQFRNPGRYVCVDNSAQVAAATSDVSPIKRQAIELTSAPLILDVEQNTAWSQEALSAALEELKQAKCIGKPQEASECWEPADKIRFLDTEDSLRAAVALSNGLESLYWRQALWLAVFQTQHSELALTLLTERLTQPDFIATQYVVDALTAMALREDSPEAFDVEEDNHTAASLYHTATLNLLRKYVRVLGDSLPRKHGEALAKSLETYRYYASQEYCEAETLIPEGEMQKKIAAVPQQ